MKQRLHARSAKSANSSTKVENELPEIFCNIDDNHDTREIELQSNNNFQDI